MRWCSLIGHRWSAGNYCVRCQAVNLKVSGAQAPSPSDCAPEHTALMDRARILKAFDLTEEDYSAFVTPELEAAYQDARQFEAEFRSWLAHRADQVNRELSEHIATHYPGYRIVDGELLYSAAWLDDNADDPIGTTG